MRLWGPADGICTEYCKSFSIRVGHFHVWMIGWLTHVFYLYCRNSKPGMFLSLQSFVGHVPFPYHHASRPPANYNPIRKSAGTLNRWLGEKSGVKSNGLRSSHPRQRGKLRLSTIYTSTGSWSSKAMHSAPSNLSQRCLKLTSGNYWHRVRKYSKTVPFMKTTWILPRGDMWLDCLLSFCTPFILHWPELVLKCFDYSIYGSRLLPTLCCSFATNNCTKRKPWNTLFLDFHSAFPWLSEAYSRWDAFLHHAKPRCSKAVRMLKPRDIRNQVRWMTSIYVPVFKDFLQVERLKLCLKRRAKKDFA